MALTRPCTSAISVVSRARLAFWQWHRAAVHHFSKIVYEYRVCWHVSTWNCEPRCISALGRTLFFFSHRLICLLFLVHSTAKCWTFFCASKQSPSRTIKLGTPWDSNEGHAFKEFVSISALGGPVIGRHVWLALVSLHPHGGKHVVIVGCTSIPNILSIIPVCSYIACANLRKPCDRRDPDKLFYLYVIHHLD